MYEILRNFFYDFEELTNAISLPLGVYQVPEFDEDEFMFESKAFLQEHFSNKMAAMPKKKFTLTQWHVDMIDNLRWMNPFNDDYFDYKAILTEEINVKSDVIYYPGVYNEPKRPFGDNTYWYNELPSLGFEGVPVDEDGNVPDEIIEKLKKTYSEVYRALQCMAWYGEFK